MFYPCYGLAESTLIVTGGSKLVPPVERVFNADELGAKRAVIEFKNVAKGRVLIGCGRTWLDQQIIIVDPETCRCCSNGHIGEIWISGPSVTQGYWKQPRETERVFQGYLRDTGEGPYLRSGDLGFLLDGELFISGRLKDLIIIGGTNHFPVDIEMTVEKCHRAIRTNCVAAVSGDVDGVERLVVVAEIDRHHLAKNPTQGNDRENQSTADIESITAAIRGAVTQNHDLSTHAICLIKQATIPRTSSGKIQRHLCREQYLAGGLILAES